MDINEILEKLPPAPAGVESWIRKELVNNTYLIYNKKENKVVCTRCGHTYRADRFYIERNLEGECPRCHSKGTYKPSGVGRRNLDEHVRVLVFVHKGKTVYGTLTEVTVNFSPFGKPQLDRWLSAVYVFNDKEQIYYKHHPWYRSWERRNNIKLPAAAQVHNWYSTPKWIRTEIYEDNLEDVFKKSCLKYQYDRDFFDNNEFMPSDYISYISKSLKQQSIELLRKSGFERIAAARVFGFRGQKCVNWRGKELKKILRLPMRHIKFLRRHDPRLEDLAIFQKLTEKEKLNAPFEFIEEIADIREWYLEQIVDYISPLKLIEYKHKKDLRGMFVNDWLDYIHNCEKLGMDTSRKNILLPEDFMEAHDTVAEKLEIETGRKQDEKIAAATFDVSIERGRLICYMARSQTELNKESRHLVHCVRGYGDSIARGNCYIFFIRKIEKKDMPFYTLELDKKGELRQCRGYKNCNMTEEIEVFVNEFVKDFKKILKIRNKERSAA